MTARERWIERHLRRLHWGQFLQRAVEWLAVFLFVFGTTVLIVKLMVPALWPHVLWLAAGAVPVAVAAWWTSRTGQFMRVESVALLDRSLGAGGLLMTLTEAPDAEWEARLPQVEHKWRASMPRLRARPLLSSLALPAVFAVGACFVPLREIVANAPVKSTAGQQATSELETLLTALEEAKILDEKEEHTLREAIAKLEEETLRSPLTHEKWETVDSLEQRMRMQLEEAGVDVAQAAQAAAILAKAADGEGVPLSAERLAELEQEVLEALQKMSQNGSLSGLSSALGDDLERLIKSGQLRLPADGEAREKLLAELSDFLEQEADKLSELRKLCEGACSKCGSKTCDGGECEGGQCADCGKECEGGLCAACSGNRPGRGGVSRGRADAEMIWGDESDEAGVKFKETVLPPGLQDDPQDEVRGITRSAPEVDPAAAVSRGAARDVDPAAGRETWNRQLRPRHRDVVRQYFDSAKDVQ
jgi:hypothetical protein